MKGARKLAGSTGGAPGPRRRRDLQKGQSAVFPIRPDGSLQIDPTGAIGTDPVRGLLVRAGDGLGVEPGSPYRLVPMLGPGFEVRDGRIRPRESSSVQTNARGQMVATPSTTEVTDPDDGTAFAKLARKANVADVPIARGRVSLVSGLATVLVAGATSDSVVLLTHGVLSGSQGMLRATVSDGVGVGIASSSGSDNSEVYYAVWAA